MTDILFKKKISSLMTFPGLVFLANPRTIKAIIAYMKVRRITSASNILVKQTVEISARSRRADDRLFIAEGTHLVESALAASAPVREIFYTPGYGQTAEGEKLLRSLAAARPAPAEFIEVPENVFLKISDAETPQGILAVISSCDKTLDKLETGGIPLIAVCDGISDPGNLGTIIRVADAAGSDAVIILPGCCDPYSPKAVRSTAGSIFNLSPVRAAQQELVEFLAAKDVFLFAADVGANVSLYDSDLTVPCAFVFGNESRGVSAFILDRAHSCIKIPMTGRAESLNAAVSAAICLFEAVRQRTGISFRS
jgi:RNA methyltransferase, TrmH family